MSTARVRRLGLPVALTFGLACGSSPPEPAGVDALVTGLAQAACDWQDRCCSPVEREQPPSPSPASDCLQRATLELQSDSARLRASLAAGTVTLDLAAAASCLTEQRARACNPPRAAATASDALGFTRWLEACLGVFHGKVAAGRPCTHRAECVEGTRCTFSGPDGGTSNMDPLSTLSGSDSTCVAYQKRGDPCQTDDECDAPIGDYCNISDHRCAPLGAAGDRCGYTPVSTPFGITTVESPKCGAAAVCDAMNEVCRPLPGEGDDCPVGTSCNPDPALALSCVGANVTDFGGVCRTAGIAGDVCGTVALPLCGGDLSCNPGTRGLGVCGPPPKAGEPCAVGAVCASPARCLVSTNTCTMPGAKAAGAPCLNDVDCATLNCQLVFDPSGTTAATCMAVDLGNVVCAGAVANAVPVGNGGFVDGGPPIGPFFDGGTGTGILP